MGTNGLILDILQTNCGQNNDGIGDFTWWVSDGEDLVGDTHMRWVCCVYSFPLSPFKTSPLIGVVNAFSI